MGIRKAESQRKRRYSIKTALESIDNALNNINTNEDWLEYLKFSSKFYNYSMQNTILIYSQNPEATYVKGYKAWNKLGRYVRKDEKGLAILAPSFRKEEKFKEPDDDAIFNDSEAEKEIIKRLSGFRITYVYDISQTDGDDSQLPVLVRGLDGDDNNAKELFESLLSHISSKNTVNMVTGISAKGTFDLESKEISIREDLSYLQKAKSLLHEYAHYHDFRLHPDDKIPRNQRELVAESVAYVVLLRLGYDVSSYSMSYLKSWLIEKQELKDVAEATQEVTKTIINELAESKDPRLYSFNGGMIYESKCISRNS